jgi:mono/diheme cytochrome c family protein
MVKSKHYVFVITLITIYAIASLTACSGAETEEEKVKRASLSGEQIYKQNCTSCHGPKGDLGISGAANLKISIKSTQQKIDFIKNGSGDGMMAAYSKAKGGVLSNTEIKKVAEYIDGFSK